MLNFVASFLCGFFGWCEPTQCGPRDFEKANYYVCRFNVADIEVNNHLHNGAGEPYGYLTHLAKGIKKPPLMLMNGGMYHDDLSPVGLYVEAGRKFSNVSTKGGWGNFHLLPNGIFWGVDGKLGVTETKKFIRQKQKVDFATQSGPMLVIDGRLHPRFLENSQSQKIRNGVGVSKDGKRIYFAISRRPVTFWQFGKLFQTKLKAHNALFLDGTVSAIQAGDYAQSGWRALGPMISVVGRD